jgi:hypothetical protein
MTTGRGEMRDMAIAAAFCGERRDINRFVIDRGRNFERLHPSDRTPLQPSGRH